MVLVVNGITYYSYESYIQAQQNNQNIQPNQLQVNDISFLYPQNIESPIQHAINTFQNTQQPINQNIQPNISNPTHLDSNIVPIIPSLFSPNHITNQPADISLFKKYPAQPGSIAAQAQLSLGGGYNIGRTGITPTQLNPMVTPLNQYITAPISNALYGISKDLTIMTDSWKGFLPIPSGNKGLAIQAFQSFGRGIIHGAESLPQLGGMIVQGSEFIAREPKLASMLIPAGLGIMAGGMVEGFTNRPIETLGEFTGQSIGFKAIGAISDSIRFPTRINALRGELPELRLGTGIEIPEGLNPEKAIKYESGAKLAYSLGTERPSDLVPLDFSVIKSLPKGSGEIVKNWLLDPMVKAEQKPSIGGSAAAKVSIPTARLPGDLDIDVLNPLKAAQEVYPKMQAFLGKENVRLTELNKFGQITIETNVGGEFHHAVQFLPKTEIGSEIGTHTGLKFYSQKPVTVEGINYKPMGELLQRKADSALTPRGQTINPAPHRMKDVIDFMSYSQELISGRKQSAESSWFLKSYRMKSVANLESQLESYKLHSGLPVEDMYPYAKQGAKITGQFIKEHPYELAALGTMSKIPSLKSIYGSVPESLHRETTSDYSIPKLKENYPSSEYNYKPSTAQRYNSPYKPSSYNPEYKPSSYNPNPDYRPSPSHYTPPYQPPYKQPGYTPDYKPHTPDYKTPGYNPPYTPPPNYTPDTPSYPPSYPPYVPPTQPPHNYTPPIPIAFKPPREELMPRIAKDESRQGKRVNVKFSDAGWHITNALPTYQSLFGKPLRMR